MSTTRAVFRVSYGALIAIVLSGCATEAQGNVEPLKDVSITPAPTASSVVEAPDPFDIVKIDLYNELSFAVDTLRFTCFIDKGYPEFADYMPQRESYVQGKELPLHAIDFGYASEEQARTYGLGGTEENSGPTPGTKLRDGLTSTDPAFYAMADECGKHVDEQLNNVSILDGIRQPLLVVYDYDVIRTAANALYSTEGLFADTGHKLAECLVQKGQPVTLTSEDPGYIPNVDMGSYEDVQEEWAPDPGASGLQVRPGQTLPVYTPTTAEAELAVAIYHCQVETKALDGVEEKLTEIKLKYVQDNSERILELNHDLEAMKQTATGLLGPSVLP